MVAHYSDPSVVRRPGRKAVSDRMAMKRIERLALPQGLSGMYGHLLFAALSNMLKWNHRTSALENHRFRPRADIGKASVQWLLRAHSVEKLFAATANF